MKTRVDEIKEIGKSAGLSIVGYGSQIFLNYQEMGLAWISLDKEPRLFTVAGYKCNIETEDLEVIRQQINEVIKKFKEYTVLKMKARIENDFKEDNQVD